MLKKLYYKTLYVTNAGDHRKAKNEPYVELEKETCAMQGINDLSSYVSGEPLST